VPDGAEVLAEAGERAYVMTAGRKLVVMDNKKGVQLYSVNFADASKYAANTVDEMIYIADETGRVGCLRPVD